MTLVDQIKALCRPSEHPDMADSMTDEVIAQTVREYESAVAYLGIDDAIIDMATEVERGFEVRDECLLRLADALDIVRQAKQSELKHGDVDWTERLLDMLELALKGDPGLVHPDDFWERRQERLGEHGPRLQWGRPVVVQR